MSNSTIVSINSSHLAKIPQFIKKLSSEGKKNVDSVTVVLKSKDHTYSHKFPIAYLDLITLSHDDKSLQKMVDEAIRNCKEEAQSIQIKINFVW